MILSPGGPLSVPIFSGLSRSQDSVVPLESLIQFTGVLVFFVTCAQIKTVHVVGKSA